jgi:hypothetical protein
VTDAVPFAYPVRDDVTVTIDEVDAGSPVTVTVDPLTLTLPAVALADQENEALWFVI